MPDASRPARVVMLLQDLAFGGTQRQALELAKRLDRSRFAPELWMLLYLRDFAPQASDAGIPLRWLSQDRTVGLATLRALWRTLGAERPDLLVLFTAVPNIWGRVMGRARKLPAVVATCRGGGAVARQHERFLKNWAAHHIVNAPPLREQLVGLGRDAARVTVIANGVDTAHFAPPPEDMMSMASVARKPTSCSLEVVTSFKRPSVDVWKTCCTWSPIFFTSLRT